MRSARIPSLVAQEARGLAATAELAKGTPRATIDDAMIGRGWVRS